VSAAPILPQGGIPAIVQAARSIEERFKEWELTSITLEEGPKEGARTLYLIYQDWARASFQAGIQLDAFLEYATSIGIETSRSTLRRRVRVGFSLTRINPDLTARMTLEQLDDAYDLILAGEGTEGVAQAVEEKSLERKAKHARTKGLDFLPLPKEYAEIRKELRARFAQIEEPELVGLAVQFAHTFRAEFEKFVEVES
jgi:hypothetical protein